MNHVDLTGASLGSLTLNQKFSLYMITSYAYYRRDLSLISDEMYDQLCRELLESYEDLTHPHRHLTSKASLQAGTGFSIEFPNIVVVAAQQAIRSYTERCKQDKVKAPYRAKKQSSSMLSS